MNPSAMNSTSQIPPPPRVATPRIRRRAWGDPRARFWWLSCLVLCLIAAGFAIFGYRVWKRELSLVRIGMRVDARIHAVNHITRPGASFDPSNPVNLQFPWNGEIYTTQIEQPLQGYGRFVTVGDIAQVRVDPQNPENWTALSEAMPLRDRVMETILTLPAILAALLAAVWRRSRVLSIWRTGEITPSLLLSSFVSPLAPLGQAVRCTPAQEGDSRVFTVYLMKARNHPEPGETIELLARPAPAALAVSAEFFS